MRDLLKLYTPLKLFFASLIFALLVLYPQITWIPYDLNNLLPKEYSGYIIFVIFRYIYYAITIFCLIEFNLFRLKISSFKKRFLYNALVCIAAFAMYGFVSYLIYFKITHFGSLILFQFFIMCIFSTSVGYVYQLFQDQRQKDQEIELLKIENLQSRYDALTNQINPHFFFNSLNGLTSLIRKKDDKVTLTYVSKLSDVFRYILQSDKKGLVTLGEELEFVDAFRYLMEVRFANKLEYRVDVDHEALVHQIPVLSIMPLLDNIVVHNMIDSDHKMIVSIYMNDNNELVVANPIYPKLIQPETNGTGIKNLENRFSLLINQKIRTQSDGKTFYVYLPLK